MKEVSAMRSRFLAAQVDWLIHLPYNLSVRVFTPYLSGHMHVQTHWHFRQSVLLGLGVGDIRHRTLQQLLLPTTVARMILTKDWDSYCCS